MDRCLVNLKWSSKFSNYSLRHLPIILLDHAPLLSTINLHSMHKRSIFRVANYWLDYIGCHLAVKRAWDCFPHDNPMQALSHLITRTRSAIKRWKASGLNSLDFDINKIEHDIFFL